MLWKWSVEKKLENHNAFYLFFGLKKILPTSIKIHERERKKEKKRLRNINFMCIRKKMFLSHPLRLYICIHLMLPVEKYAYVHMRAHCNPVFHHSVFLIQFRFPLIFSLLSSIKPFYILFYPCMFFFWEVKIYFAVPKQTQSTDLRH